MNHRAITLKDVIRTTSREYAKVMIIVLALSANPKAGDVLGAKSKKNTIKAPILAF